MKNIRINVDDEFHKRLKLLAVKEGRTIKELVLEAVERLLREREGK